MSKPDSKSIKPPEPAEPALLRGAKMKQGMAEERAKKARAAAEAASKAAKEQSEAIGKKAKEAESMEAERATLAKHLSILGLDDPKAEKLASRLRHSELIADRMKGELTFLQDTKALNDQRLAELSKAAEIAEAESRNAARAVRLTEIQVEFPRLLQPVLDVLAERRGILGEADVESHAARVATIGRARVFPAREQMGRNRGLDMEELENTISRHAASVALVPSAVPAALDPQPGNGDGDAGSDRLIEEAAAAEATGTTPMPTLKPGERYYEPRT